MSYPLYRGHREPRTFTTANKGLLFDKFYNWNEVGGLLRDQDKATNLKRLTGACGEPKVLEKTVNRQVDLISTLGGDVKVFRNEWHFVTGMGKDHPLENGMTWHPTLGTPYIAGSSVKGMVRAYCEVWKGWDEEKIASFFGTNSDKEGRSGDYIFFDAIPTSPVDLTTDVMTPHMGNWYEAGGEEQHNAENTPGDWHSPVPVTFLAVKNVSLLFGIAPRRRDQAKMLPELMLALTEALEWIGVGAKTASGYGYFTFDSNKTDNVYQPFKENKLKTEATEKWNNIAQTNSIEALEAFLDEYSNCKEAKAARERLEELNDKKIVEQKFRNIKKMEGKKRIEALRSFIVTYPNFADVNEANTMLESLTKPDKTVQSGDLESILQSCDSLGAAKSSIKKYLVSKGGQPSDEDRKQITAFFKVNIVLIGNKKKQKKEARDYKNWVDDEVIKRYS